MKRVPFFPRRLSSRFSSYSPADRHIDNFKSLLGDDSIRCFDISKYTNDWTKRYTGGAVVALPRSTEDISKLLAYCHREKIAVVPQGGNTGLVGGQVGSSQELILSLERLNKIKHIDSTAGVAVVDSGCVLQTLSDAVAQQGFIVPLDLGAKGSCQIGGNVATNAGGMRVLRYGSMHQNILGMKVVQADGTILDMLREVRKDNCGYHLKNLLIGSEGTLGVITQVAIQLAPKPRSTSVILLKLPKFEDLSSVIQTARSSLGEVLSAVEFMDESSLLALQQRSPSLLARLPQALLPAANTHGLHTGISGEILVLLEVSSSALHIDQQRLEDFSLPLLESGAVTEVVVSQDLTQEQAFWSIRENVPVALMEVSRSQPHNAGRLFKYDVSLPLSLMTTLVAVLKQALQRSGLRVRSRLQTEASLPETEGRQLGVPLDWLRDLELDVFLNRVIFDYIISVNGSISAEHGIGQQKAGMMSRIRTPAELSIMAAIKAAMDPRGILNPGKVLQPAVESLHNHID